MMIATLLALLLTSSVIWLGINRPDTFTTALHRLYLLDQNQWPRDCHVELIGVKVKYDEPVTGIPEMNSTRSFFQGSVNIAKAANVSVLVRAEMPGNDNSNRRLPRLCEFIYRSSDGQRGRLPMNKVGGTQNGFQSFALDGDILERITGTIRFYVRGDDHTIGPYEIVAVSPPVVVKSEIDCEFPAYLVDVESSRFTAREIPYSPGLKLPNGTKARLEVQLDSPVEGAYIVDAENQLIKPAEWQDQTCWIALGEIEELIKFGIVIKSQGVFTPSPLRFRIDAEQDQPPQITSRLRGIGSAVTPEARIPVMANIIDKHGIQRTWIELQTPMTDSIQIDQARKQGTVETEIDLRQLRISGAIPSDLPTQPDGIIQLTFLAKDYFDLDGGENVGTGMQHPLDVVTADKLLRILERDETDQRFRLEQIYKEMTDTRSYISRAINARSNLQAGYEPGDEDTLIQPESNSIEDWDLRQLFLQRALLQSRKSTQEIEGVAFSFDHIRLQLINNRIDAEDRKRRLQQDVAEPLKSIVAGSMPVLEQLLIDADILYQHLTNSRNNDEETRLRLLRVEEVTSESLTAVDSILSEIQSVLDSLLKFETQNELLDLVRRMLDEQESLRQRTEALRNREAFNDIFDK